jgi:hypothetical protein
MKLRPKTEGEAFGTVAVTVIIAIACAIVANHFIRDYTVGACVAVLAWFVLRPLFAVWEFLERIEP